MKSSITQNKLSKNQRALAEAIAAEGLAIQNRFRPEPLYRTTGKGHYNSETVHDIAKARLGAKSLKKSSTQK